MLDLIVLLVKVRQDNGIILGSAREPQAEVTDRILENAFHRFSRGETREPISKVSKGQLGVDN